MEITEKEIGDTITAINKTVDTELLGKTKEQLDEYWHFEWEDSDTLEQNLYNFHDMLELYGSFCNQWEEAKNGSCCIVERVRDKYLMPKIREFVEQLTFEISWNQT